ncbi:YraN family protein [Deinococcus maricopensis]|uniref:UPF0102 protein Deima_0747 n=1 Tax=Deinococcus maricopensis (strain DSM 21211 / LMG 22137 / NRRL B-23946 / LB-34) TaxID=709986 RepID=E8U5R4_DEIML|nr:YraN family protein [Deinococcus maricopensis]ADV66403.1 UPF0102 protein yraN [Deinococcus maricopensis DSM 21211]
MKGADAETRAWAHLSALGHALLHRNYRVPGGEIDLITRDGDTLVFTEVRHRARATHGTALESVTPRKVALLLRAATAYLTREYGRDDLPCRFDLITIDGPVNGGALQHHQAIT